MPQISSHQVPPGLSRRLSWFRYAHGGVMIALLAAITYPLWKPEPGESEREQPVVEVEDVAPAQVVAVEPEPAPVATPPQLRVAEIDPLPVRSPDHTMRGARIPLPQAEEPVPAQVQPVALQVAPRPPPRLYQGQASDQPVWKSRAVKVDVAASAPKIAIVLDDLGLSTRKLEDTIALPGPITLAFLPYGKGLEGQTRQARAAGHEILMHMPMQPGGEADPGPNPLKAGMSAREAEEHLLTAIKAVPGIVGFNNHMGSSATSDPLLMKAVAELARREGLILLDSRTTRFTAIPAAAKAAGTDWLERDVFLDHEISPTAIRKALSRTEAIARETGQAIAIGHPHPETLAALAEWLPEARSRGIAIVPVSHLAE